MRKYSYTLILLFFYSFSFSKTIDSLSLVEELSQIQWEESNAFRKFGQLMTEGDTIFSTYQSVEFYKKGLEQAERVKNDSIISKYLLEISQRASYLFDAEMMIEYGEKEYQHALKVQDSLTMFYAKMNVGLGHDFDGNHLIAIKIYTDLLDMVINLDNPYLKCDIIGNLSEAYLSIGQLEEAISLIRKNISFLTNVEFSEKYFNIVADYSTLLSCYTEKNNKDSILYCINKINDNIPLLKSDESYSLATVDYHLLESAAYSRIVKYYLKIKEFSIAENYFQKFLKTENPSDLEVYNTKLHFNLHSNQLAKTKALLNNIPASINPYKSTEFLKMAHQYYEKVGDYEKSLEYYKKLIKIQEQKKENQINKLTNYTNLSIQNFEKEIQIAKLQNEQIQQKKQNQIYLISLLSILLFSIMLAYFYFQIRDKNKVLQVSKEEINNLIKQKDKLLVNVAHELQTPLAIITGLSKQIQEREPSQEIDNFSKVITNNSQELSKSVSQILEISRIEESLVMLNNSYFYLNELIDQVIYELHFFAENYSVNIIFDTVREDFIVEADIEKVKTILKNLITNGIKHSSVNQTVRINLSKAEDTYVISVKDSGKGILAEEIPKLFDKYYQGSSDKLIGGFGIGLTICKEYVELLNGRIEVRSELNKGSTFTIYIPNQIEDTVISEEVITKFRAALKSDVIEKISDETYSNVDNKKVLIVEDNNDYSIYLKSFLSPHFELHFAGNGDQAIEKLRSMEEQPDLILTDWMMPHKDGLDLVDYLRKDKNYQTVPIIMLTARLLISDQVKSKNRGVNTYLIKPIDEDILIAKIKSLTQQRKHSFSTTGLFENHYSDNDKIKTLSFKEREWLLDLEQLILRNINNFDFSLNELASLMDSSYSQLVKKTKAITDMTPKQFINEIRYWEARRLLEEEEIQSVKIVSLSVGFKHVENFSRNFKKRFGRYPSEYLNST